MAYSDYGGYAYRNGVRVVERSDATITPEGDTYGTPGSYPGFALLAAGVALADVKQRLDWPSGHAVLGDGPIYVVLRKRWASAYRGPQALSADLARDWDEGDNEDEQRKSYSTDGYTIEVVLTYEDNYYVYAKLTQPDGTLWHGWSGYGVGAGFEDGDYGFSTADRDARLLELWPESIRPSEGK